MSHPKPSGEPAPSPKRAKTDASNGSAAAAPAPAAASASKDEKEPFVHPHDWPLPGPIDLATADLPHATSDTEWWYVNGHVNDTATGRDLSFFASFFRIVKGRDWEGKIEHAHSLTWAIVDATGKTYHTDPLLDRSTPEVVRKQLLDEPDQLDPRMRRAFLEVVNKGRVPLPDRLAESPAKVSLDSLSLAYDNNLFYKDAKTGHYYLECGCAEKKMSLKVKLEPLKPPHRQAHDGVVKIGVKQDTMFYYYIPRNKCTGSISLEGKDYNVTGEAWYDHEFGGTITASRAEKDTSATAAARSAAAAAVISGKPGKSSNGVIGHMSDAPAESPAPRQSEISSLLSHAGEGAPKRSYGWNWLSCQLSDGTDITATNLINTTDNIVEDNFAIVSGPAAEGSVRVEYPVMELKGSKPFHSCRTTADYPTVWHFSIPAAKIELVAEAVFPQQELLTLIAQPAFWEGRLNLKGTINGKAVTGKGFLERHGFWTMKSLDAFFKRISLQVMAQVDLVMPHDPTYEQTRELLANKKMDHFMSGVSLDVFKKTIVTPLREIIDRGGKSWRSFAFLLCIDCVGGDSEPFKHWLAMPELMHVGSLIVDDIQDKSLVRRGGPSCHAVHGDAIAINAGTAAYFLSWHVLDMMTKDLTTLTRNRMYELYFLTLRAGHCGQAFDINGLDYLMDEAVRTGDSKKLESSVLCTHRLKSAVPAGNLARMGALVGGGSEEQIDRVGMYMESLGLAFQIIDDVLNLKGFEGNVKDRGEDIKAGKITFPVAKAMSSSRLDLAARTQVWETIKSKPQDIEVVGALIRRLDECGAINAAIDEANAQVNEAWAAVDAILPESFFKIVLRAFGWYVLERHY